MNIQHISRLPRLRVGVVGAGVFGRHHAAKYANIQEVDLVAVADPSADARRYVADNLKVPTVANWNELLGQVDAVSICSPASTHAEIVRAFLSAGAHVMVEKPIATDLDEAEELIALAAERNLVLTVGHQERFVFAKSGLLDYDDAPLAVECVREGPWTGRGTDVSVVLDLMIHDLDLVHQLVPGAVSDIRAYGRTIKGRYADEVTAQLRFDAGTDVRLIASRAADARKRSMRVIYADGVIEIDFMTRTVRNTTGRTLKPLALQDPLGESIGSFVTAAHAGADALVRPEEARQALETALAIEEAAEPANDTVASGVAIFA